jgi:hypothetical protein
MKPLLLLLPILGLAACAGQQPMPSTTSSADRVDSLPAADGVREPSQVHTYVVNDYIDPNNPRLLHQGHPVDVVEQDEKWNLNSGDISEGNYGPVAAANDPNAAPNPYSAEFETELAQQREQYRQLAALGAQMTTEMGRLQDMAQKEADSVSENASFRDRLQQLQHEIDELKPQPTQPVAPNTPKKPSWLDPVWDLFRQVPDGKPVTDDDKPTLQTNLVLRPLPPTEVPTLPTTNEAPLPNIPPTNAVPTSPAAPTNAPAVPPEPSIPAPGEMSQPDADSTTQP